MAKTLGRSAGLVALKLKIGELRSNHSGNRFVFELQSGAESL